MALICVMIAAKGSKPKGIAAERETENIDAPIG
jgi:hypothetical protein